MILDKRASRQMARKAHKKQKAEEKPGRDVGENEHDKVERKEGEGDGEKKLQYYKDPPGAGSVTGKPVSVQDQAQVAVRRNSPAANASMTSYNPITHVSSKPCFIVQLIHVTQSVISAGVILVHILFIS